LNWKSARLNFFLAAGAAVSTGAAVAVGYAGADAATSSIGASGAFYCI